MPQRFQALAACALCLGLASVPASGQETLRQAYSDLQGSVLRARVGEASAKSLAGLQTAWAAAQADGWELVQQDRDLAIYQRAKPGTSIREVKAVGAVDAAPATVWKVIGDYENYASFMPYVKECRVVKKAGDRVFFVYQHLEMPLVSDRDFTIKITWEPEPKDGQAAYRSSWVAANEEGPAPQPGLSRVLVNDGSWTLEPMDGGKRTRATYYLYTDPGGIPAWAVNMGNKKALPELFKAVRSRSRALP